MSRIYTIVSVGGIIILALLSLAVYRVAQANPDQILENSMGSSAGVSTSSPAFLSLAAATTTANTFDTQTDGALPAKSATLLVAYTPSSTASTLNISFEYCQTNCLTNGDWFGDDITSLTASTSQTVGLGLTSKFVLQSGTTTNVVGGQQNPVNTIYRAFTVPVPTRYVRAVIAIASSSVVVASTPNASVWSDFIAKKETR